MVTPVFRILDYHKAREFYIDWLGFRIDWEDQPAQGPVYFQVSRGDFVLHLSAHTTDSCAGARARVEILGLPAYHHQLTTKDFPHKRLAMAPAFWNKRVLEMEVYDPFGNCIVFCELDILSVSS
ncbi:glyoxalase superfamily protein [Hymenobacter terricola]|uniref:glyoxalase superfamily protein n=1 Tax=Hymenobacter terricola TaxID=2819236 RepID=UPI001B311B81|nr:glyoxalase superfamily protein [Hymenobacter terricola]